MGGMNTLSGTLAPNGTNIWHLDGTVVVTNSAGTVVPGGRAKYRVMENTS
jgi:hypothetical protein